MEFKKILVTGFGESELDTVYWERIRNLSKEIIFTETLGEEVMDDVDGLFTKFNPATQQMIESLPSLKYIGVNSTGYGKIDISCAQSKGITVTNVPGYSTSSVSEFTFAVLLEHKREISRARIGGKNGDYSEDSFYATEIRSKNFGILGLGEIGRYTAGIALGFGANVSYWSKNKKDIQNVMFKQFDNLLRESDIISINIALNDETEGLFDADNISKIQSGAVVINTSPMELFNIDALSERLEKNDITFILDHADEMTQEDLDKITPYKNCIIYPPIGYISEEAKIAKQEVFVSNIEGFCNDNPSNIVSGKTT